MLDKYSDPNRELAVSFNLRLPINVYKYITLLQSNAKTKATELRNYDTSPHLAIATKFMPFGLTDKYIECIRNEFVNLATFKITFDTIIIAETKSYIFFEPSRETKHYVNSLRDTALKASKEIGYETPKNQPQIFKYTPHVSIIKCHQESINSVFSHLQKDLKEVSGTVDTLFVTREQRRENGYAEFPEVLTIHLE